MTALLAVELRRGFARRLVRVAALIVVLGIAITGFVTAAKSKPLDPASVAAAEQQIEACVRGDIQPPQIGTVPPGFEDQFDKELPPGSGIRREVCEEGLRPPGFQLQIADLKGILGGTTGPLVVIAIVLGASLVAAEWRSGNMATTLTWEPRRVRLMVVKLAAALIVAVAFYLVMQALLSGVLWLVSTTRGSTAGADAAFAKSVAGLVLRAALLVAFAATIGFAIGSIGKNTAAALGVAFGYLVIFEQILFGLVAWIRPWLVIPNAIQFVSNEPILSDLDTPLLGADATESGIRLAMYAAGLALVAIGMFKTRDVSS